MIRAMGRSKCGSPSASAMKPLMRRPDVWAGCAGPDLKTLRAVRMLADTSLHSPIKNASGACSAIMSMVTGDSHEDNACWKIQSGLSKNHGRRAVNASAFDSHQERAPGGETGASPFGG